MGLVEALFADSSLIESLFGDTFTVERRTRTHDGMGGWIIGYTAIGTVAGRIRPATSEEITVALQEQRKITHVLYVDGAEDIQRGDRLSMNGLSVPLLTVDVVGVRVPSQVYHHLEIDCNEVQQEATDSITAGGLHALMFNYNTNSDYLAVIH